MCEEKKIPPPAARILRLVIGDMGLTYDDVCNIIGVDRRTVFRWMDGTMRPSHEQVCRMEELFGVSHRYWLHGGYDLNDLYDKKRVACTPLTDDR